jgi:hypothetical protein
MKKLVTRHELAPEKRERHGTKKALRATYDASFAEGEFLYLNRP